MTQAAVKTTRSLDGAAAFAAVERWANRAAPILMAVAGTLFWLSLMVLALVASLGWKFALL